MNQIYVVGVRYDTFQIDLKHTNTGNPTAHQACTLTSHKPQPYPMFDLHYHYYTTTQSHTHGFVNDTLNPILTQSQY